MDVFEINEDSQVIVEEFMGSKIYYIDNFFKTPDDVVKFLDETPTRMHKPEKMPSYLKDINSIEFSDIRHVLKVEGVSKVCKYLQELCGQEPVHDADLLMTNMIRFFKTPYNDYKNNFWWPHNDNGYTGLIYLNKDDTLNGTNLYKYEIIDKFLEYECEHSHPWRNKNHYSILKTIETKYNRCVLFDGFKFLHGMNIENDRYFNDEYRRNMVFFFNEN